MSKSRNYTDEEFVKAVEDSGSLRQVLQKLNLREAGGNYQCAKERIRKLGLSIDHFHGQAWNKGKKLPKRQSRFPVFLFPLPLVVIGKPSITSSLPS